VSPGRVRLVALDIDGTLLRSDRTLSARTRQAVAQARRCGVRVALVTGRRHPSARRIAAELGEPLTLVVHNGAMVVEQGEIVHCRPLASELAARAIRAGRSLALEPIVHSGLRGEGWLNVDERAAPAGLVGYYLERAREELRLVPDLLATLAEEPPMQVMFGGALDEMERLHDLLAGMLAGAARLERTVYPESGFALVDVLDAAVGKGEGVAFLQRRFGIAREETLAVGDNWNDRSMLEAAGVGLLMGNAPSELLALGLPRLPTNDEDGVALALETHVLGSRSGAGFTPS
jgi:Cof subfamily protein (haloacid dehalogenase superfamily)